MAARSGFRYGLMAVCVVGTTLGLNNTYGDNADVLKIAEQQACGKPDCAYTLLRQSRSAFSHEYSFQTHLTEKGKDGPSSTSDIRCKRALVLLGEWQCVNQTSGAPAL